MTSIFTNPHRRVLPGVIKALQELENDPQRLARERDQRYNELLLLSSESGDTTLPPTPGTPGTPIVDKFYQRNVQQIARNKSIPFCQFESQTNREEERIFYQLGEDLRGRKQTLPFNKSLDYRANSENNVRSRWVKQGIWRDDWGPAWLEGSCPMSLEWRSKGHPDGPRDGPFYGTFNPTTSNSRFNYRWGHEEYNIEPNTGPEIEPVSEPQSFGPKSTVRDPEASRPYHQFVYQVSIERDWIKDEVDYKTPGRVVDLDAMAHASVKNNWIKDGIWNPKWIELPGMTWIHEEPEDEESIEVPVASDPVGGQLPNIIDDKQQPHAPQHSPDLSNRVSTDNNAPLVTEGADIAQRRVSRRGGKGMNGQSTAIESARSSKVGDSRIVEDLSRRTRGGRVKRHDVHNNSVPCRRAQSRRSTPAVTESPVPGRRRSTRLKDVASLSRRPQYHHPRQPRRSRRLAQRPPEFGNFL